MENQQPQPIQIKAKDEDLKGSYSNVMQVMHTKEEFVLDFLLVVPPTGVLTSRIAMSPGHIKRMITALQNNLKNYQEKFGDIKEAEALQAEIGF